MALAAAVCGWPAAGQTGTAPAAPQTRFLVVLDAAHGGEDAGGRLANGQAEKAMTLAMSVRLRSLLGARGMEVVTTREQDKGLSHDQRAEIANHANARACISLHATETGSGVHLVVSNVSPTQAAGMHAWKTAQGGWVERSLALAGVLNHALLQAGMTVTLSRMALPGVDSMTCPAVAVEMAPERDSGQKIKAELDDADYQARVAGALAAGLLEWRAEEHRQ